MRIGIDFDNTIVDYTGVFYLAATKLKWIPKSIGRSKNEVKQYFIDNNNEDKWTELQGIVYGKDIIHAKPYVGVQETIDKWLGKGHELFIISHKTQYPIIGERLNFHDAARLWLKKNGLVNLEAIPFEHVFFNQTKEDKLLKVAELSCDIFIDDLPAILFDDLFPAEVEGILFDVNNELMIESDYSIKKVSSWSQLAELF